MEPTIRRTPTIDKTFFLEFNKRAAKLVWLQTIYKFKWLLFKCILKFKILITQKRDTIVSHLYANNLILNQFYFCISSSTSYLPLLVLIHQNLLYLFSSSTFLSINQIQGNCPIHTVHIFFRIENIIIWILKDLKAWTIDQTPLNFATKLGFARPLLHLSNFSHSSRNKPYNLFQSPQSPPVWKVLPPKNLECGPVRLLLDKVSASFRVWILQDVSGIPSWQKL